MYAIIPAAGLSTRIGDIGKQSKILLPLYKSKTVLQYTIERLISSGVLNGIVVVIRPNDKKQVETVLGSILLGNLESFIITGGESRQQSVYNALRFLQGKARFVLVHDAARANIEPELVREVAMKGSSHGAAILAVHSKSSLKQANNGFVENSLERKSIWEAQTPQVFEYKVLFDAHNQALEDGYIATDDSELVERLGIKVCIVEGSDANIKITTQHDLEYMRMRLKTQ